MAAPVLETIKNIFLHVARNPLAAIPAVLAPVETFNFFSDPRENALKIEAEIDAEVRKETWVPRPVGGFLEAMHHHRRIMEIYEKPDRTEKEQAQLDAMRDVDRRYLKAKKRMEHPNPFFRAYIK